jgi:hypothetical protein
MKFPRPHPDTATEQKFLVQEFGYFSFFLFFEFGQYFLCYRDMCMSLDSVVVTAPRLRAGLSVKTRKQEIRLFSKAPGPSLWPTQAPDECVLMTLTLG